MKKLLAVLAVLLLFVAVPAVSADHAPEGADDEQELEAVLENCGPIPGDLLTITKEAEDEEIYLEGGCLDPQWTNLTITVTGSGGVEEDAPDLDVVFAIDSSGSMDWNDPSDLRLAAAKNFTERLENDADGLDYAGVVSWDDGIDFTYGLVSEDAAGEFDLLRGQIDNVDASGLTDLNVGLNAAIAMLDATGRADADGQVIIFLTDGAGTYTPSGSGGPASVAAAKDYKIYSIGLGSADMSALNDMADATGGKAYSTPNAETLKNIFNEIYSTIILNSAPYNPYVRETVQGHIVVDCDNITPTPSACWKCTCGDATHIEWYNVGKLNDTVGKYLLTADDTFEAVIPIASTMAGDDVPIDDDTGDDCCADWTAQVFYNAPDGEWTVQDIPQETIDVIQQVALDLKPTSCPNAFNPNQKGVLPVAVAGDECFDVTDIDPATVKLNGVAPIRWDSEDVTSPIYCPAGCYDCVASCCLMVDCLDGSCIGCDGYDDLTFKFDVPTIAETLGCVSKENCVQATLTGELYDGTPIEGYDWLWITKDYEPENGG